MTPAKGRQRSRRSQFIAGAATVETMMTPLKAIRLARGLKQMDVAKAIGTHPANLLRIEAGTQMPQREMAHALFDFYNGEISLGAIYDGTFAIERGLDDLSRFAGLLAGSGVLDAGEGIAAPVATGGNGSRPAADATPEKDGRVSEASGRPEVLRS